MPVGALQAAEAIGQHGFGKQTPHGATDQRTIDAFSKILFRRNTEAVGNDVDVGGRIAHLDSSESLLGGLPIAKVVDLRKTFDALIASHAVEKVVPDRSRATFDRHLRCKLGTDWRMLPPGCGSMATCPIAQSSGDQGLDEKLSQRRPARVGGIAIKLTPLPIGQQ